MTEAAYLRRLYLRPDATLDRNAFPGSLPYVPGLDIHFDRAVTFLVGENGSGKSTVVEAIAELSGLPVAGGGRNELADLRAPHMHSELAPLVRASFARRPREGYFFRAEFQAHFASLLEQRRDDPDFLGNPYARYGGRSLHTRSHGEAFLAMFSSWMTPGLILMDEPEAALSPQRQLALLVQMANLVRRGDVQFIIATHSPVLLTFPQASLLSFDDDKVEATTLEATSHYRITQGILANPQRYWSRLLADEERD